MVFRFVLRSDRRISKQASACLARRDTGEKLECALDELEAKIAELMETDPEGYAGESKNSTENPIPMLQQNMEEMGTYLK